MNSRQSAFILLLAMAGFLIAYEIVSHQAPALKQTTIARVPSSVSQGQEVVVPDIPSPAAVDVSPIPATEPVAPASEPGGKISETVVKTPRRAEQRTAPLGGANPVVPPELARQALSFVGADPDAEMVWGTAINDANVPANVRKDLIEDLNEDGFADPKNITPDDLPLIESRLALIEEIGGDAMDDVNAAAFAEAYKDLVNMYNKVARE